MVTSRELAGLAVDLTYQVSDVRAERDSFRFVLVQALHLLHQRHLELKTLQERHRRVIEEYRKYRAATIGTPKRAA